MPTQHHGILIHAPRVRFDIDVFGTDEHWMNETWPKALRALKTVCETPT